MLDLEHLVPAAGLVQAERRPLVELRERVLHLVAVVELRSRRHDRLEREVGQPREPLQRVGDPALLVLDLRLVREILEAAAAAGGVVRAGRLDPCRAGNEHLGRDRLGVPALHFRDARPDRVARETAPHEDDEAVQARDAVAAECERVDRELELLVSLDGGSHLDHGTDRPLVARVTAPRRGASAYDCGGRQTPNTRSARAKPSDS